MKKNSHYSLDDACRVIFGGIGACSPELYAEGVNKVAELCGRTVDDMFRVEIIDALRKLPCPLD
jgi:hypothetical protein